MVLWSHFSLCNSGTVQPHSPSTVGCHAFLSLSEQIIGTSTAFIGSSPSPLGSDILASTVQIDDGSLSYVNDTDRTYKQRFTTPKLPDGKHTITIRGALIALVDYAVVKVGIQTSLTRQTVIVDDDSSLIQYSGQWSRNTTIFIPGSGFPTGYPYGNVTHRSSNPSDTFTFRFSGKLPVKLQQ